MKKSNIISFLTKNAVSIFAIAVIIIYLFVSFSSIRQIALFISCFLMLYLSAFSFNSFFKELILKVGADGGSKVHFKRFAILISIAGIIFLLSSSELFFAILLGCLLVVLFLAIYYIAKKKWDF